MASNPTTRSKADQADSAEEAEETARFPAHVWVAGNGSLQVPLAGLLVDAPELRDAELTAEGWQQRLDEYLRSPRH